MKNLSINNLVLFLIVMISINFSFSSFLKTQANTENSCHPQCSWKCDDPHCPAICDPVCEPPKCHTSCAEPKNAICDVKCEKPECEIKCPDKGCEMFDCPKCVTVCKQPHCVTHCQAPKPECEAVCEEPKCDWKCHKPACPKPKCELVCENPNCSPKVECCACNNNSTAPIPLPFPFFKETENNPECCGCNNGINVDGSNIKLNSNSRTSLLDYGTHVVKTVKENTAIPLDIPTPIGDSFYNYPDKKIEDFVQGKLNYNIPSAVAADKKQK